MSRYDCGMPITEEVAQLAECDACGARSWSTPGDIILGVSGVLSIAENWGGYSISFFSCSSAAEHVMQAMENAIGQRKGDCSYQVDSLSIILAHVPEPSSEFFPFLADGEDISFPDPNPKFVTPGSNANPKSDMELRTELQENWVVEGVRPSKDRIKKLLHIGDRRAQFLIDTTPDPT